MNNDENIYKWIIPIRKISEKEGIGDLPNDVTLLSGRNAAPPTVDI